MCYSYLISTIKPRGDEGRGEQQRGLCTKALMWDLGTRLECQQIVFGKALWK